MANGYGGGSSSPTTTSTNAQGETAPAGFHYMPDGTLMSNAEHTRLYGQKIITSFILDTSDIKAAGETRNFEITGDNGAVFSLEIKNGTNYYNFQTNLFQATETKLSNITIGTNAYTGSVSFPKVAAGAQYDVFLFSEGNHNTRHAQYIEVRANDGSIDINSSTGSNSNLVQKVIYQTLDVTITLGGYSPNGTVTGTLGTQTITTSRNRSVGKTAFTLTNTVTSTRTLTTNKQPDENDVLIFISGTIGSAPIDIPGEDIYPAVTNTDTVDGAVDGVSTRQYVMDTNVADKMAVGDKITTAVTTDTIDGGFNMFSGNKIVMDNNVATKMNVGDAITGTLELNRASAAGLPFTVNELNPDTDNVKEFSVSGGDGSTFRLSDGGTLTFSSILNRQTITVATLNPDGDNVKEFRATDGFAIRDGATLSFSNRKNYRWPISSTTKDLSKITAGMQTLSSNVFASQPQVAEYLTQTTVLEGEVGEYKVDGVRIPALDTLGQKPISVRDGTTKVVTTTVGSATTPINIVFSQQALFSFANATAKIFSYGSSKIEALTGYDVEFSDLAVTLSEVKTTTTAAVNSSTSVPVANRDGIMDGISTVKGIGINTIIKGTDTVDGAVTSGVKVVMDTNVANTMKVGDRITGNAALDAATVTVAALNPDGDNVKEFSMSEAIALGDNLALNFSNQSGLGPKVVSGAGSVTGAGTIVLSAAQTLENGIELTFPGASTVATITGNIKVNKVGNEDLTLRFDLDKLLTMH